MKVFQNTETSRHYSTFQISLKDLSKIKSLVMLPNFCHPTFAKIVDDIPHKKCYSNLLKNREFRWIVKVIVTLFWCSYTINDDLLIAKLHVYGLDKFYLKVLFTYLTNRFHRTNVLNNFSSWSKLVHQLGVPQRSDLGPILFKIYLNDLFCLSKVTSNCNYADKNVFHASGTDSNSLLRRIKHDALLANEWFNLSMWNWIKINVTS